MQAYPGPALPASKVAILQAISIEVVSIDGNRSYGCTHCDVHLEPGAHTLEVKLSQIDWWVSVHDRRSLQMPYIDRDEHCETCPRFHGQDESSPVQP